MIYGNQEGHLEIHPADDSGYHQRHPNEPGRVKLSGVRGETMRRSGSAAPHFSKKKGHQHFSL